MPFLLRVSALWSRSSILQPFPNTCTFFFYLLATETSHSEAGTAQLSSLKRPTIDWTRAWQLLAATSLLLPTPTMGPGHRLSCSYLSSVLLHCRTGTLWLSPSSVYWVIFPFSLSHYGGTVSIPPKPPRRPHQSNLKGQCVKFTRICWCESEQNTQECTLCWIKSLKSGTVVFSHWNDKRGHVTPLWIGSGFSGCTQTSQLTQYNVRRSWTSGNRD